MSTSTHISDFRVTIIEAYMRQPIATGIVAISTLDNDATADVILEYTISEDGFHFEILDVSETDCPERALDFVMLRRAEIHRKLQVALASPMSA